MKVILYKLGNKFQREQIECLEYHDHYPCVGEGIRTESYTYCVETVYYVFKSGILSHIDCDVRYV